MIGLDALREESVGVVSSAYTRPRPPIIKDFEPGPPRIKDFEDCEERTLPPENIGRVEEWKSGRVEEWKSGGVEEWKSGRAEAAKPHILARTTRKEVGGF